MSFAEIFQAATGCAPFPWQSLLYEKFTDGNYPTAANIPTGLGKTSVVAIWLIALALYPEKTPRRLVYVVNRRTVVDQTTAEVEKLRKALVEHPALREISDNLRRLCALPLPSPDAPPLAISTLRGQFADNREWSADPARPAVIIGTVDMIGSGLLFSRYTVGFKLRPHHAAFLAQDVLLVHDEAHLEPAFQKLLDGIVEEQSRSSDPRKLRVMELSATTRSGALTEPFVITEEDKHDDFVRKRLNAVKKLWLVALGENEKEQDKLIELALACKESGRAILVFVRPVESAVKIAAELGKKVGADKVVTLTGTMRGRERDELVARHVFQRFLPGGKKNGTEEETVWLVATSAGEVGVNISADDLICDVSTYESMAQRFGRVNRFGECDDSRVQVVHPSEFPHVKKIKEAEQAVAEGKKNAAKKLQTLKSKEAVGLARERTLSLLLQLGNDACPAALERLSAVDRAAAFSPLPGMRTATAIQFDAWALTSIRKPIAARPPVSPYLHGESEFQPPETYLAWRDELDILQGGQLTANPLEELLEDFPLKPHELLRDTSKRIAETLSARIGRFVQESDRSEVPEDIPPGCFLAEDGTLRPFPLITSDRLFSAYKNHGDRSDNEKTQIKEHIKYLESALAGGTLILPASLGGISEHGLFIAGAKCPDTGADVSGIEGVRLRLFSSSPDIPDAYAGGAYRLVRAIDTHIDDEAEDFESPTRYWLWLEARNAVNTEKGSSVQSETLASHTRAIVANVAAIAEKLLPANPAVGEPDLHRCLRTAAEWHDVGKNRRLWQIGIGNTGYDPENPDTVLAKAGGTMRPRHLSEHYRHEFGSLHAAMTPHANAQSTEIMNDLSTIERDIVLHLVAAHHGRARPHFPAEEVFDYDSGPDLSAALAAEVPNRFASLQHCFGRWGLAWLESILRAADYAASAGIVAENLNLDRHNPLSEKGNVKSIREENKWTITLRVDVTNPGQFFACCGLFELAGCLAGDVLAHFEQDKKKAWRFVLTAGSTSKSKQDFTLNDLLKAFATAELSVADDQSSAEEDEDETDVDSGGSSGGDSIDAKAPSLKLGSPFNIRLDWWATATNQTAALKVWAGSMDCFRIALAMKDAVGEVTQAESAAKDQDLLFDSRVIYERGKGKPKKVEPFYFDAKRGPNADSRDVGFSPNSLKLETVAAPAVEILCLIGLQRAVPVPAGQPRQFIYHTWTSPLPISLLAAAINGQLPDASSLSYRFESWFRTSQRKHKAFLAAQPIARG